MFTLKDKAGIATSIAAIAVAGTALGTEAHQTLVSILAHIRDHGDTSQLTAFVKALPSMARRNAVGPYVQHFSGKQLNVVLKDGEWNSKLVGKREVYLPYNNNMFMQPKSDEEVLGKHHYNPDFMRWELHRVWVVEANLKPGQRHQAPDQTLSRSVHVRGARSAWMKVCRSRPRSAHSKAVSQWA